jgi:hypothetical protein
MAAPTTQGSGVPAYLIPDPFAHQLAFASQMGRFDFDDAMMNAVDPRALLNDPNSHDGDGDYGVNLIILNSLTSPLKLTETQSAQIPVCTDSNSFLPDWNGPLTDSDHQVCYPAGSTDGELRNHEIPAARTYPNSQRHLRPDGSPAFLAGLGWYRFDMYDSPARTLSRALSFQVGDDTTHHVGMIIRLELRDRGVFRHQASFAFGAVTADLEREYGSIDNFFQYKMPNPNNTPWGPALYSMSASDRSSLTVWTCPIPHDTDRLGINTVVAWVRDISSTVG